MNSLLNLSLKNVNYWMLRVFDLEGLYRMSSIAAESPSATRQTLINVIVYSRNGLCIFLFIVSAISNSSAADSDVLSLEVVRIH